MKNSARKSKLIALVSALVGLFLGVVLSNLNNNDRKDAEHYIRILEEEEEDDEVNPVLDFTILSCIVLLLIFLTILFELLKDHAEEHASRNAKPIVEALFGELTVLGFLSVFTFVATHTGILQKLGEHLLGPARHEDVLEAFESVHYTIFFIMVFFVIQVLVLVKEASETEELWLEYERIVVAASNQVDSEQHIWSQCALDYQAVSSTAGIVLRWIQSYGEILPFFRALVNGQHVLLLFKALRDEFVLDRELDYPFQPSTEKVEEDFNFGRYLGVCQSILLQKVVHVKIFTWVLFALGVVVYYLFVLVVDCNQTILSWTWVALAWFLCLYNIHFERHLISVIQAFASKRVYSLAHHGQEPQGDESTALLERDDHLLPDWCRIEVQEYSRKRSWWTRVIAGHAIPNRQQALYWMDRKGPPLYLFILQFDLLFVGIFAAMQYMSVGPFMYHNKPHWQFVLYLVLASLPILNIVVNKRRLVAVLTPVCSLGVYRRPQVIASVIRENKTVRGIRTFIVVYKLRRFSQQATPTETSDHAEATVHYTKVFDHHEIEEVAKVFGEFDLDGSGSITYDEFEKLMSKQGAHLSKEQLHNMVSSLDTDKSGAVDKEEFIQWYADHAQDDDISEKEFAHFMFHVFDENDSGEITIGEFKKKLEQVSKRFTVDEIGMLVNELDSNNDGTICEEEFEELIRKYYPKELSRSHHTH